MGFQNYILGSLELGDRISLLLWEMSRRVCFTYTLPIWKSSRSAVLMIYYNPKFKQTAQNFRLFKKNCEVGFSCHSGLQGKSRNFTEAFASSWLNNNIHNRQRKVLWKLSMDVTLNVFLKSNTSKCPIVYQAYKMTTIKFLVLLTCWQLCLHLQSWHIRCLCWWATCSLDECCSDVRTVPWLF